MMLTLLALFLGGAAIGVLGTLVGVGGGFLLVPIISLLEPTWSPRIVTAYSLAVVSANAVSGSIAYLRRGRVDIKSALPFACAALPGAIIGVFGADIFSRTLFNRVFACMLAAMSIWLALGRKAHTHSGSGSTLRHILDCDGHAYTWSFDMRLGLLGSALVGISSALFGIGGGPINVPFLVLALHYPEHIASATSHAVLAITSIVATFVHLVRGDYAQDWAYVCISGLGAIIGAPFGALLSRYLSGRALMRALAIILAGMAIRLAFIA